MEAVHPRRELWEGTSPVREPDPELVATLALLLKDRPPYDIAMNIVAALGPVPSVNLMEDISYRLGAVVPARRGELDTVARHCQYISKQLRK